MRHRRTLVIAALAALAAVATAACSGASGTKLEEWMISGVINLHEPGGHKEVKLPLTGLKIQQFHAREGSLPNFDRRGIFQAKHRGNRLAEIRLVLERLRFLAAGADVRGETELGGELVHLGEVVALVQAEPLRPFRRRAGTRRRGARR